VMNPPIIEVRLAELRDVAGLTALEERHYIGNLDPAKRAGGFISILHSTQWFAAAIDSGARCPGTARALLAGDDPPGHLPARDLRTGVRTWRLTRAAPI